MNQSPDAVAQQLLVTIEVWSSQALGLAVVLAAIGTITMALLELLKAVTRARLFFHRFMIARWVGKDRTDILKELLVLVAGGTADAVGWYDQADDRLIASLEAAAVIALNYPLSYPLTYKFLVISADDDSAAWEKASDLALQPLPEDANLRATSLATLQRGNEARLRLGNLVQRKIDVLSSRLEWTWSRLNQLAALLVGILMTLFFLSLRDNTAPAIDCVAKVICAILGGLIAPFAKDIVSALSGLGSSKKL